MISPWKRLALVILALTAAQPGASAAAPAPDPLAETLKAHVSKLTGTPAPRNYQHRDGLEAAADYVEAELRKTGADTARQEYALAGKKFRNIICRIGSGRPKTVVVGAHYDVCGPGPGADDNASGVAGLIELARLLQAGRERLRYSVELVAYANEEPPFFRTPGMGSHIHAASLLDRKDSIAYMVALEMIGFYSDKPGSQRYPVASMKQRYPDTGNFIAVAGNADSAAVVAEISAGMRKGAVIDCQTLVAPANLPGMDFSDHLNYWAHGIKAVMVTDTAFFRNPNYHKPTDTPDTLNYANMAQVVKGLAASFQQPQRADAKP